MLLLLRDLDSRAAKLFPQEDDTIISMMIEGFLAKLGCEVVVARTLAIDAAVLDVNLDGEMSHPVAEALEARKIPFLFTTSHDVKESPERLVGVPLLSKPFGMQQLAVALRLAMENQSPVHGSA